MRVSSSFVPTAVVLCALVGCVDQDGRTGNENQPIIGGTTDPGDDAVVLLSVGCTGTLIAPNVVLTAAHCLPAGRASFGPAQGNTFASRSVIDDFQSRRYDAGLFAGGDIALLRLEADAPPEVAPVAFNTVTLTDEYIGATIRTVGFGVTDGVAQTGFGTKRQVVHLINGVLDEFLVVGDDQKNTCQGDSGGPTFLTIDGTERVVAVTSFGAGGCLGESHITRVDVFVEAFINEVVDAWSGPCAKDGTCVTDCPGYPDPDCAACGVDGICSTGCVNKDLDCPLSGDFGDLCAGNREACESLLCVDALDDPRVSYCTQQCDPASTEPNFGCPSPFTECVTAAGGDNVCGFGGITPSTQGAACDEGTDCRSGVCDPSDAICIEPCGDGFPACIEGFDCRGVGGGVDACRLPKADGCAVGSGGAPAPLGLVVLALVLVCGRSRRRNRV